jgi:lipoate-protein ligase A
MLFDRLVVYEDRAPAGAALNMAIDEALLDHSTSPTIRFYGWLRPAVSFGYFADFAQVERATPAQELVRRWTGGGSVPHGEDLTYSIMIPASEPTASLGPPALYTEVHEAVRAALVPEGWEAMFAPGATPKISGACFANPVRNDLLIDGRKIAGAAQRRTRRGILHQGSIQVSDLSHRFRGRFVSFLSTSFERKKIPSDVLTRAAQLAAEKYGTEAWLRRR